MNTLGRPIALLRPLLLALLLGACTVATDLVGTRDKLVAQLRPLNDKALELLIQETWESPMPCWFPNPTWQRRIAVFGSAEKDRFLRNCDPLNLTMPEEGSR